MPNKLRKVRLSMKIQVGLALQRINRALIRKYGEMVALDRLMSIGDILFEYIDEDECVSKEFYDYILKNI